MAKKYPDPKQLLKVGDRPLVEYVLDALPKEIDELIFIVGGPHEEKIRAYFSDAHNGRKIRYAKQTELLGLGHAIQQARGLVHGKFLVLLPDDIYDPHDLQRMIVEPDLAALAMKREDWQNFGVFVTDENHYLTRTVEKPKEFVSDMASVGCYLLDDDFFEVTVHPSARGEIELPDLVMKLVTEKKKKVRVLEASLWFPVNDPDQLDLADKLVKARLEGASR